jgi:hypothetical protein
MATKNDAHCTQIDPTSIHLPHDVAQTFDTAAFIRRAMALHWVAQASVQALSMPRLGQTDGSRSLLAFAGAASCNGYAAACDQRDNQQSGPCCGATAARLLRHLRNSRLQLIRCWCVLNAVRKGND